ncbi:MAG: helicase-related protein [bacterium]|nr:helicase-related protein [bacterium]
MSGKAIDLHYGQKVRLPGETAVVTVEGFNPSGNDTVVIVSDPDGNLRKALLSTEQMQRVRAATEDGGASPEMVLAGLWAERMAASVRSATSTVLASSRLRPYPHQMAAVYGQMLSQTRLRFLLADEPGTGKTIMSGLWLRESQRLGRVKRALVVCPAHLVQKWQADFDRFFGGGLEEVTLEAVQKGFLSLSDITTWVVSMHRAAINPTVLEGVRPDNGGWDAVIFDEAHRMTPTAETFHNVGTVLSKVPQALFLTATPHRGKEWLFQDLLHLVDPELFPKGEPPARGRPSRRGARRKLKPGPVHFLRRMKEPLVDYDRKRKLFKPREAKNVKVPLNSVEQDFHDRAIALVREFFPPEARSLAGLVYGKRAASSLHALSRTLHRRIERMGTDPAAPVGDDWYDEGEEDGGEGRVEGVRSMDANAERKAIRGMLDELEPLLGPELEVSKWAPMIDDCLNPHGITPHGDRQAVVFTEYADTAGWLVERFRAAGFTSRRYSGDDNHLARAQTQADFRKGDFQVLVSTDAGNEGIDLQSANVLVNWDMPWSLVRLEQRLGRIHRIGQQRKAWFYNLVALGTRESQAHETLLDNLVKAANQLDGRIFDSLNAIMERLDITGCFNPPTRPGGGIANQNDIIRVFDEMRSETEYLESDIDLDLAQAARRSELLQRIEPDTVERFLDRLVAAGLLTRDAMPLADRGFYYLAPVGWELPPGFPTDTGGRTLVTTREQLRQELIDEGKQRAARATLLTPSRPVFRQFAQAIRDRTQAAMWQGAVLSDPSAREDYTLFVYETILQVGTGNSEDVSWLISVDQRGTADRVAWETLPNLASPSASDPRHLDARAEAAASAHAEYLATAETDRRKTAAEEHAKGLNRELRDLPDLTTEHITNLQTRIRQRQQIEENVRDRVRQARRQADITHTRPRRLGWAYVTAGQQVTEDPDSEAVSMRHVTLLLEREHFVVDDVHKENIGFDLLAERGADQRCVEVKGRRGSASNKGIELTGGELEAARFMGDEYWLYVVDHCEDGIGTLFHAWQNPEKVFRDEFQPVSMVRLPGSALKAAQQEQNGT